MNPNGLTDEQVETSSTTEHCDDHNSDDVPCSGGCGKTTDHWKKAQYITELPSGVAASYFVVAAYEIYKNLDEWRRNCSR